LPPILKALRLLHEAVNKADTHVRPVDITRVKSGAEFMEAHAAEHRRYGEQWRIVGQRACEARRMLARDRNSPYRGPIDHIDPALPVEQRARLKDVWEQLDWEPLFRCGNRDQLLLFLEESIALLTPGGPKKPDGFEWQGHVCPDLTLHDMLLLTFFWDGGRRRRCATFEELRDDFWGSRVTDGAIRSGVSRCNTKLEEAHIFIGLGTEKYTVVCTWGE
jgi:hypothetical protein